MKLWKNKKGFSLTELLAVIVIIGVLSSLVVVGVSRYIEKSHTEKTNQNRNNVSIAAELYLQSNRNLMPNSIGESAIIPLESLRAKNYIKEDVTNSSGESCMEKSYVRVYKLDIDEYSYTTYLYCGDDEVPDEPDVPEPVVLDFEFSNNKNAVKDASFSFTIKGAADDDTVGIYSYYYSIVDVGTSGNEKNVLFSSGDLKGGLEPSIRVQSKSLSQYFELTDLNSVQINVHVINEQGGVVDYHSTSNFNDKEKPECGSVTGAAKDDNDWINKQTYNSGVDTNNSRRITVGCTDHQGSGCKRDIFTRLWPNNSRSVSGIDYRYGARWSFIEIQDNSKVANKEICYVRANVDIMAPKITLTVYKRNADGSNGVKVSSVTAEDDGKKTETLPTATLDFTKDKNLAGQDNEKWMNKANYPYGINIDVEVEDNLYLHTYDWYVNDALVPGGTDESKVRSTASIQNAKTEQDGGTSPQLIFSSNLEDNPKTMNELKIAEHGLQSTKINRLVLNREGKRYAKLVVCDKAKNCSTIHIYANIDVTPPNVPKPTYKTITSNSVYTPATAMEYTNTTKWSKEFIRGYINGQREDRTNSLKSSLSGWSHFEYSYQQQSGKNSNGRYTWKNAVKKSLSQADKRIGNLYGFDINDQGVHIVKWISCDVAQNCSSESVTDYVKVDTIKPECSLVKKYEDNGKDITKNNEILKSGSTNGSGWLKIGQKLTLSHSCNDDNTTNGQFSSGCDINSFYNKQSYVFDFDINTRTAGANGYDSTYGTSKDKTSGGHVIDYAGNISDLCDTMDLKIDHIAPKCDTLLDYPNGEPINPTNQSKIETGWLGLVNGKGTKKKTAVVSLRCTDKKATNGVSSSCDDDGRYDKTKSNSKNFTYNKEINTEKAGALGDNKGGQVFDIAGNVTLCPANRTVRIDYTPPSCSTSIEYGVGSNKDFYEKSDSGRPVSGWLGYVGNDDSSIKMAKVSQVCSDPSGKENRSIKSDCYGTLSSYIYDTEINTSSAGALGNNKSGYVYDRAGNVSGVCPNNKTVKIDQTRPVCSVTTSSKGSGNGNNWFHDNYVGQWLGKNAVVTIVSTCSSDESGTGNSSGCDTYVSLDYKDHIHTTNATSIGVNKKLYVYDVAGNRSASRCEDKTVRIDLRKPTCDDVSGDSTNWTANSRNISVTCGDGVDQSGCTQNTFSHDYTSTTKNSSITISDKVGNTEVCPINVYVDKTNPVCVSSGGKASWQTSGFSIFGTCSDGTDQSGCVESPISRLYNSNTKSVSESPGVVYDAVGNYVECPANQTVKIDLVKPIINSIQVSSRDREYSTNEVDITISGMDDFSGVSKACILQTNDVSKCTSWYDFDGSETYKNIRATDSYDGSSVEFYAWIKDVAGNVSDVAHDDYTVYTDCTEEVDDGDYTCGTYGACSAACGYNGIQYANKTQRRKDKYTGAACESIETTNGCSRECNRRGCCSSTSLSNCGNATWTACSASCGPGTKSEYKICDYISDYDGSVCETDQVYYTGNTSSCDAGSCATYNTVSMDFSGTSTTLSNSITIPGMKSGSATTNNGGASCTTNGNVVSCTVTNATCSVISSTQECKKYANISGSPPDDFVYITNNASSFYEKRAFDNPADGNGCYKYVGKSPKFTASQNWICYREPLAIMKGSKAHCIYQCSGSNCYSYNYEPGMYCKCYTRETDTTTTLCSKTITITYEEA